MSKPLAAMLTLKRVESGEWDLKEPLFHYWIDPELPTVKLYPESKSLFFLQDLDVQFECIGNDSLIIYQDGSIDCKAIKIEQPPLITLSPDALQGFEGTYHRSDEDSNLYVNLEEQNLILTGESIPEMILSPVEENLFIADGFIYQFEFATNATGKITRIDILENGQRILDAKKIE